MELFDKASLKRKQVLIIMVTTVAALLLACAAFAVCEAMISRKAMERELSNLAGIIGSTASRTLEVNDPKSVRETLSTLKAEPNVIAACIFAKDGNVVASYDSSTSHSAFNPPKFIVDGVVSSGGGLAVFRPILREGALIGVVYLKSDLQGLHSRIAWFATLAAGIFAAALVVAYFLSNRLQGLISDPILRLAQTTSDVTREQDYSLRVVKRSEDEMGVLTDSFNMLLEQIQGRDEALQNAQGQMEKQVEERTKVLASSLSLLQATFESTADGILVTDAGENVVSFNEQFIKMWGIPDVVTFLGDRMKLQSAILSQMKDPEMVRAKIQEIQENAEAESFEILDFKDGRIFERYSKLQSIGEQGMGRVWSCRDVTERRRAEVTSLAFSKLGQSLMAAATPREAARSIADVADELFGWDACCFYLCSQGTDEIYPVLYIDTMNGRRVDELPGDEVKRKTNAIDRRVVKNGAELILKEGPLTMEEGSTPFGDKSRPSASIMRVPVRAGNQVVGILNVHSYSYQAYNRKDLTVLQTLADYCGGALDRINAENALRKSESQFRVVWDSSADGMRLTNSEGDVLLVNDAYCRMVQKSKEELEGQPLSIVYHPDVADRILTAYKERVGAKAIEAHSEREVTLWNGSNIWLAVSSSPVELPGQSGLLLSILRDVSRRKQAQAELAYERDLLKTLLENSPDQIYFKDDQSCFIKCSKSLSERFGVSPEELIGKCDLDFFSEEHARPALEDEHRIMHTGEPMAAKIEKEVYKGGSESWVLTSKMPLRDKSGEIIGTFGISKDITAIKQAEAKLEEVHKQLMDASRQAGMAEVATSVLHNVGNVLNSVNISSSLASDKIRQSKVSLLGNVVTLMQSHAADLPGFFAQDPKGRQLPSFLSSLADRLNAEQKEILQELSLLAKNIEHIKEIVSMQQSYAKVSGLLESLEVVDLVEDALRMNAGAMERHHVHVIREFAETPPVLVEKHKVLQILINLIRNSKYALDDGPALEKRMILRTGTNGNGMVRISVVDNGIGIPAEIQTRIFGLGFTTRKEGHGFGLHNGALAAKELGGSLTVHSEGLGKGATFTLEFPSQPKGKTT